MLECRKCRKDNSRIIKKSSQLSLITVHFYLKKIFHQIITVLYSDFKNYIHYHCMVIRLFKIYISLYNK